MDKDRKEPRTFEPGPDDRAIVERLVSITAHPESHAKVRRRKAGRLVISAVTEKMVN